MAEIITFSDLPTAIQSAELIHDMVAGANAKASRVAPCLAYDGTVTGQSAPSADMLAEAKLVLLGALKRWAEAGAGSIQSQNAGPFGMTVDTRQRTGYNLWPSEINDLQGICKSGSTGAFIIDTVGTSNSAHVPWCALMFGALYCSCGSDLNNYEAPLFEGGILSGDDY